ncbi:MAG: SDR family oxidoreductase [Deltaproteobacteria bacterium]|nr:SDR family oxidoreductase [Deltaproteobacteria bacterium]
MRPRGPAHVHDRPRDTSGRGPGRGLELRRNVRGRARSGAVRERVEPRHHPRAAWGRPVKLQGSVAVVTGGGRGIGRAIALALAEAGAAVAVAARTAEELDRVVDEIRAAGGRGLALVADVTKAGEVDELARATEAALGPPQVLVNDAGIVVRAPLVETSEEDWDAVMATNVKGAFLCCRSFLPGMIRRMRGRIVNIASISGRLGTRQLAAYCASKWALVGLTKALAEEVREHSIQVNAIAPGSVATDMLQAGMPGAGADMTPSDIARVVLFLASDAPDALTGSVIDVFG